MSSGSVAPRPVARAGCETPFTVLIRLCRSIAAPGGDYLRHQCACGL